MIGWLFEISIIIMIIDSTVAYTCCPLRQIYVYVSFQPLKRGD